MIPETNSKSLPLKMDGWNTMKFPFGSFGPIFRGELLVSGRATTAAPQGTSPKSCAGRRRFHPTVGSDMSLGSVVMETKTQPMLSRGNPDSLCFLVFFVCVFFFFVCICFLPFFLVWVV